MNLRITRLFRFPSALSAVCLTLILASAHAQEGLSPAASSRLTGVSLPARANHLTDRAMMSQINAQLKTFADQLKSKCGDTEVLGWTPDDDPKTAVLIIIQKLSSQLRAAGWSYEDQAAGGEGGNSLRIVAVEKQGQVIGGFWIVSGDALLLAWCGLASTAPAPKQVEQPAPATKSGPGVSNALEGLYVGYYPIL